MGFHGNCESLWFVVGACKTASKCNPGFCEATDYAKCTDDGQCKDAARTRDGTSKACTTGKVNTTNRDYQRPWILQLCFLSYY